MLAGKDSVEGVCVCVERVQVCMRMVGRGANREGIKTRSAHTADNCWEVIK